MTLIKGRVWKFGDNINTDLIAPAWGPGVGVPWEEAKKRILHINPAFAAEVKPGDVIVGGRNWGCGSGRPAAGHLKRVGVAAVVAESFARLYFRNSIATACPAVACPGIYALFDDGDLLELDLATAHIRNVTKGKEIAGEPLSDEMLDIIAKGGILPMLQLKLGIRK